MVPLPPSEMDCYVLFSLSQGALVPAKPNLSDLASPTFNLSM
jgi:hypothetical protein